MALSKLEIEEISFKLGNLFKPATPINRADLFAGRKRQVQDVVDAINLDGRHVILFGERGVGKTSLANILFTKIQCGMPILTPHINCTTQDTFHDIWGRVFDEIRFKVEQGDASLPEEILEILKPFSTSPDQIGNEVTPDSIRRVLFEIGRLCVLVIIIDEFDTVASPETRQTMADTLKFLSDKIVPATVLLIGASDDVETMIAQHQSTERCLVQIQMPRMSTGEISDIVVTCLKLVEMTIESDALKCVAYVSKGLPHYAHLLGLHSSREAINNQSKRVTKSHILLGIRAALERVQASVQASYRNAISSSRKDAQFKQVLLACALAPTDEFGYFAPVDVREPLSTIKKGSSEIEAFARHLHAFSTDDRGSVLRRKVHGTRRPRFRFTNPLLQPYILLRGVDEKLISEALLEQATSAKPYDPELGYLF